MKFIRLLAVFTATLLLFTACADKTAGQFFRYDIPAGVRNLDPQFATDATARMIIQNTFEGLFRQLPTGEIVPCLAERYDLSDDGLVYTFHLRRDARWNNPTLPRAGRALYNDRPVTAHDFVFTFTRLFNPDAPSPFADSFDGIQNAALIARRAAPPESLGVRALDDYTLEITLLRPDRLLPELLAASYAMPCNADFFQSTRARYGMELPYLLFNGPFTVSAWDGSADVALRQNALYPAADPVIAGGVNLIVNPPDDAEGRFLSGTTDACKVSYDAFASVLDAGGTGQRYEDVVWVLVLNCRLPYLQIPETRRALAYAIDRELFTEQLPANLRVSETLVPPAVSALGEPYRAFAGEKSELLYSPHLAKQNSAAGLSELASGENPLDYEKIPLTEILVPDQYSLPLLAGYVQQGWQKNLAVYTGLQRQPLDELLARVASGDFQAAILPLSASYSSPDALLSYFTATSTQNLAGYQNPAFDALLTSTADLSGEQLVAAYAQAEQLLLYDAPVIPLFFETSCYAMSPGVTDVAFSPFLSGVYFKYARKDA